MVIQTEQGEEIKETETRNEMSSPYSLVLEDQSPRKILEVNSLSSFFVDVFNYFIGYKLPLKYNRGKPPNRYTLDYEERTSKYAIANHVST